MDWEPQARGQLQLTGQVLILVTLADQRPKPTTGTGQGNGGRGAGGCGLVLHSEQRHDRALKRTNVRPFFQRQKWSLAAAWSRRAAGAGGRVEVVQTHLTDLHMISSYSGCRQAFEGGGGRVLLHQLKCHITKSFKFSYENRPTWLLLTCNSKY